MAGGIDGLKVSSDHSERILFRPTVKQRAGPISHLVFKLHSSQYRKLVVLPEAFLLTQVSAVL